jgi:hypothetical protein
MTRWSPILVALLLGATFAGAARAETPDPDKAAALEHYDRGVELARQGHYQEALDEFSTAYEKSPNYAVLYNIGQAYIGLKKPIEALKALEQYVDDAKTEVAPERLERIKKQIAAQRAELVELRLAVNTLGAAIEVDGRPAGTAPLSGPLWLTPGTHLLVVSAPTRATLARSLNVEQGKVIDLTVELLPLPVAPRNRSAAAATVPSQAAPAAQTTPAGATHAPAPETSTTGTLRTVSYVLGGVGVALEVTAAVHYIWNRNRYDSWQAEDKALHAEQVTGDYQQRQSANNELATSIQGAKTVTLGLALGGGVCLASGVSLFFLSASTTQGSAGTPSSFAVTARGTW